MYIEFSAVYANRLTIPMGNHESTRPPILTAPPLRVVAAFVIDIPAIGCDTFGMSKPQILNVAEAAERLGLSAIRVRQFCQEGRLGQKCGGFWIISEQELRRFARKPRPWGGLRKKNQKTL